MLRLCCARFEHMVPSAVIMNGFLLCLKSQSGAVQESKVNVMASESAIYIHVKCGNVKHFHNRGCPAAVLCSTQLCMGREVNVPSARAPFLG